MRWQQETRDRRAAEWRRARARLAGYGPNVRGILRRLWHSAPYPATPEYLLPMLHSFDIGRIDPDNPPWIYRGPGFGSGAVAEIVRRSRARLGLPAEAAA
ncbi:MAG: hypothetical protein RLO06_15085 [Parvibaculum sp.]